MIRVWKPILETTYDEDHNLISKNTKELIREIDYKNIPSDTQVLYLNDNLITSINLSLLPIALKKLYCAYNQIKEITGTPFKNLEYIDVSFNNLETVKLYENCKINFIGNPVAQDFYRIKTFNLSQNDIFITFRKGTLLYPVSLSDKEYLLSPFLFDTVNSIYTLNKSVKVLLGTNPTFYDQKDMKKVEKVAKEYGLDGYLCNSEYTHIGIDLQNLHNVKKSFLIQTKDFYSIPKLILF